MPPSSSMTALAPCMPRSQSVRKVCAAATGATTWVIKSGQQGAQQRQDQHGLESLQLLGQRDTPVHEIRTVPGDESGHDAAQEARAHVRRQQAADHAGRDAGPVAME